MSRIGYYGERLDLEIKQGSTFGPVVMTFKNKDGTPMNLSSYLIRAQLRKSSSDTSFFNFIIDPIDAVNGIFLFKMDYTETEKIIAGETLSDARSLYQWDMEAYNTIDNTVFPVAYGKVKVLREITK